MKFNNANSYNKDMVNAKQRQAIKSAGLDWYLMHAEKVGSICDVEIKATNGNGINVLFKVRNDNGDGGFFAGSFGPRGADFGSNCRLPA